MKETTKCYCGHTTTCDCGPEQYFKDIELTQQERPETLEEAALRLYPIILEDDGWDKNKQYRDEWIEGAKWQQERSYSEEEVLYLLQKALRHQDDGETGSLVTAQGKIRTANFYSWFNKIKKK